MPYPIEKYFKNKLAFLEELKKRDEKYWLDRGKKSAMRLFHVVSERVPAYKKILKKNKISVKNIRSVADFKKLPLVDKSSYLKSYPLPELCLDGKFSSKSWVISATSGSTGEPFYFPRTEKQDLQYALTAEMYLLTNFNIDKKTTLYVNGFAMGVWIGGLFTYQAIKHISEKNKYPLSIINPGTNKVEILKSLKKLAPYFDQVIIGGYPPFIKDLVDFGASEGFLWKKHNVKFIFSAEGFSEEFRNYIIKKVGLKNPLLDTLNHYGTVDLGTMSYETPVSILVRRLAIGNKKLLKILFGQEDKLPTLTQYIPEQFYFEELDRMLVCSSAGGLPLVRYDLKDNGGIFTFRDLLRKAKISGIDLLGEINKAGISHTLWQLPFVYVYERADFSVSFYGANIYPETIRKVLMNTKYNRYFTGKCVLEIEMSKNQDQILCIHIEENNRISTQSVIQEDLKNKIFDILMRENSEFKIIHSSIGSKAVPVIRFWSYEHPIYFKQGGKQKWVKK